MMSIITCPHDWEMWNEGEFRQHRRCRNCPSEQWRDSLLPKSTRAWLDKSDP